MIDKTCTDDTLGRQTFGSDSRLARILGIEEILRRLVNGEIAV
jgi:hypothetical protein